MNIFKKEGKIKPEELRVEKITKSHLNFLNGFNSYEKELESFLKEDALEQQERNISVTYLWFLRENNELVAYITLSPDCIKLKNINEELSKKFRDKGINYKSLPALKIGRLCVCDNYLRKGVGTLLIQFTIKKAFEMSQSVGCRFIYLDAKRNKDKSKDVIHFYQKFGFEIYKDRNNKETPMYLDISPFIKELTDLK